MLVSNLVLDPPGESAAAEADPSYRCVLSLRGAGALADQLRRAWRQAGSNTQVHQADILQTHYKAFDRSRLVAEAIVSQADKPPARQHLFLQVYAAPEQARRRFAQAIGGKAIACKAPAVTLLEESSAVVWALPNGPRLRRAKPFFKKRRLQAFLEQCGLAVDRPKQRPRAQLMRYVPRKRALFRCLLPRDDAAAVYFKVYAPGQDVPAAANLQTLAHAGFREFRPPPLLAHHRGVLVLRELPGTRLTELLPCAGPSLLASLGAALAELHGSNLVGQNAWTAAGEMSALRTAMHEVRAVLPATRAPLEGLLAALDAQIPNAQRHGAPIHGNLFGDQILVDEASGQIGIVDWDDFACGDPLYDVGRLIAHFIFVDLQHHLPVSQGANRVQLFLDGYVNGSLKCLDWQRLRWHVAAALLLRAKISALRPLIPHWAAIITRCVDEAHHVHQGRSPWLPSGA